jgi:hypothetical protein
MSPLPLTALGPVPCPLPEVDRRADIPIRTRRGSDFVPICAGHRAVGSAPRHTAPAWRRCKGDVGKSRAWSACSYRRAFRVGFSDISLSDAGSHLGNGRPCFPLASSAGQESGARPCRRPRLTRYFLSSIVCGCSLGPWSSFTSPPDRFQVIGDDFSPPESRGNSGIQGPRSRSRSVHELRRVPGSSLRLRVSSAPIPPSAGGNGQPTLGLDLDGAAL